jgi:hypothetical protein
VAPGDDPGTTAGHLRALSSAQFFEVTSTLAPAEDSDQHPLLRASLAGVLDAAARGVELTSVWLRGAPKSPLEVYMAAGAEEHREPDKKGDEPLSFPVGAFGRRVQEGELRALLGRFNAWVRCGGSFDPLLRPTSADQGTSAASAPETFDRQVEYLTDSPFAWVVSAAPRSRRAIDDEAGDLLNELYRLRQTGGGIESDAIQAERREGWFRELASSGAAGVWDVAIYVGAPSTEEAARTAAIFCAAAEVSVTGYRLCAPADTHADLVETGTRRGPGSDDSLLMPAPCPFPATSSLVASLVRPPVIELPGLRQVVEPSFDTTPEGRAAPEDAIELGDLLDRFGRPTGRLSLPVKSLNKHTFVCGATGSGKSQTVRNLLEALSRREPALPWLVVEPAKAEYARMAGRLKDLSDRRVLVIRPGDPSVPPASLNPLEPASLEPGNPARTYPLQSHADLLRALFLAAFRDTYDPFPQMLSSALTNSYGAYGWDLPTGEANPSRLRRLGARSLPGGDDWTPRYPGLADLEAAARTVVDTAGYDAEGTARMRGYVDVRMRSLRQGTPGRFFSGGHPLDFAALLRRNAVLEMESIANDQDKAFVMGAVLVRLYEQLLLEERERFAREKNEAPLRHVTVLEEAHRLLRRVEAGGPGAHSIELFAALLAEVRSYGEGIVVAEQIPGKILVDVVKNTSVKIVHRLPAADDREAVGATMNLSDEQSAFVVGLREGYAATFADGMDRPLLAKMDYREGRESAERDELDRTAPSPANCRRSAACGETCRTESPCTVDTIGLGERLLLEYPEIELWAEAACVAHMRGSAAPYFRDTLRIQDLRATASRDVRLVECASASAIDGAITSRYVPLAEFYDPDSLAAHLSAVFGEALAGGPVEGCGLDVGRWRAGVHRYADVAAALDGEGKGLSPKDAALLARARGVELGGGTPEQQLAVLKVLPRIGVDEALTKRLTTGTGPRVGFLEAANQLRRRGSPHARVRAALRDTLSWPSDDDHAGVIASMFLALPEEKAEQRGTSTAPARPGA